MPLCWLTSHPGKTMVISQTLQIYKSVKMYCGKQNMKMGNSESFQASEGNGFKYLQYEPISPIHKQQFSMITNVLDDEMNYKNKCSMLEKQLRQMKRSFQQTQQENKMMRKEINNLKTQQWNHNNREEHKLKMLSQENQQLRSRLSGYESHRSNSSNNSYNNQCGQNRFYVEQLQKNNEMLQRENRRLSNLMMRKLKNGFNT